MHEFDVAIIGSGPTAVAALDGLGGSLRIAVVTGVRQPSGCAPRLHPKIHAVSAERGEVPAVGDLLQFDSGPPSPLFSTAVVGGLANYWGQQFLRYGEGDAWPAALFKTYADYAQECELIERLFRIEGGGMLDVSAEPACRFRISVPRLLTGTPYSPHADLEAMRLTYRKLELERGAVAFETRAQSVFAHSDGASVELENGESVRARLVLLAAGVIGDALLLSRSYPDLRHARFQDHSPWMIYVYGFHRFIATHARIGSAHFNAVTLEEIENDRSMLFASAYDMSKAGLNLLLASTIGQTSPRLRGWASPVGAGLITPVQVWTPATLDAIEIEMHATPTAARVVRDEQAGDEGLATASNALMRLGARVLKVSRARPGSGFHYHALEMKPEGGSFAPVADLLSERTRGSIVCVDPSILPTIGCRPHTLTAMAAARRITRGDGER